MAGTGQHRDSSFCGTSGLFWFDVHAARAHHINLKSPDATVYSYLLHAPISGADGCFSKLIFSMEKVLRNIAKKLPLEIKKLINT